MPTEQFRINFDDVEWQSPLPGCRFKAAVRGNKQVRLLEFTSDFVEPYWCEKGHTGVVLEGELEVDFHGEIEHYPQGSGLYMPAGPDGGHKARSVTDRVLLFLVEDA